MNKTKLIKDIFEKYQDDFERHHCEFPNNCLECQKRIVKNLKEENKRLNILLQLKFEDIIHVANGCFDYNGGYSNTKELNIFHHGIQTVVNALNHINNNGINDLQSKILYHKGKDISRQTK